MGSPAVIGAFYQFFGAISQDLTPSVDHLARKGKVNVQMSNDRDESSPRSKTAVDELPPADTTRWTPRRKAAVVEAVLSGEITIEEVCHRYDLTVEEFLSWRNTMERHGVPGLRTTRLKSYRHSPPKQG